MNQGSNFKTFLNDEFNSSMQQDFEGVEVIIFDETSMLSDVGIYDLERRFKCSQKDSGRREQFFGGRHVIFMGARVHNT